MFVSGYPSLTIIDHKSLWGRRKATSLEEYDNGHEDLEREQDIDLNPKKTADKCPSG